MLMFDLGGATILQLQAPLVGPEEVHRARRRTHSTRTEGPRSFNH